MLKIKFISSLKKIFPYLCVLIVFLFLVYNGNDFCLLFENQKQSQSLGTVSNGSLIDGKRMPSKGKNFETYSYFLSFIGRTCIHSKVREVVVDAYKILETTQPDTTFIYGEMGWCKGGRFRPHRTHQNGLSVDFMVPLRYKKTGLPATIPTNILTSFGYSMRFDETGIYESCWFRSSKKGCTYYQIDFKAMIEHLDALQKSVQKQGIVIDKIIIDPPLLKLLRQEKDYFKIENFPFMQGKAWFPHDGHYHVDFKIVS